MIQALAELLKKIKIDNTGKNNNSQHNRNYGGEDFLKNRLIKQRPHNHKGNKRTGKGCRSDNVKSQTNKHGCQGLS